MKQIFKWFLEGMTGYSIAKKLTEMGTKTPAGKDKWHPSTVERILHKEKYKGDLLLQKGYTVDFLTKKKKKNEGEIPQYYVEEDHEAIIDPATFDMVQAKIRNRQNGAGRYSGVGVFSSKIKCGCCGGWYGAKVWHSNSKYRKIMYRCNRKYDNDKKCTSGSISEEEIESAFVAAANKLLGNKDEVIANIASIKKYFCETGELEERLAACEAEIAGLAEKM